MPTPIQTPEDAGRLADRFGVRGRLGLVLDEVVSPVTILDDLSPRARGSGLLPVPMLIWNTLPAGGVGQVGEIVVAAVDHLIHVERILIPSTGGGGNGATCFIRRVLPHQFASGASWGVLTPQARDTQDTSVPGADDLVQSRNTAVYQPANTWYVDSPAGGGQRPIEVDMWLRPQTIRRDTDPVTGFLRNMDALVVALVGTNTITTASIWYTQYRLAP